MRQCQCLSCFFFQAEDGIRYLVRSRGLGDVYKRQAMFSATSSRMTISDKVKLSDRIAM